MMANRKWIAQLWSTWERCQGIDELIVADSYDDLIKQLRATKYEDSAYIAFIEDNTIHMHSTITEEEWSYLDS